MWSMYRFDDSNFFWIISDMNSRTNVEFLFQLQSLLDGLNSFFEGIESFCEFNICWTYKSLIEAEALAPRTIASMISSGTRLVACFEDKSL